MSSVIIDGKNSAGQRKSVSIPDYLFDLVLAHFDFDAGAARAWIRDQIADDDGGARSWWVQMRCLRLISKPSLVRALDQRILNQVLDGQMDIEDK